MSKTQNACPECLQTFPDEIRFCGSCGVPLVTRAVTDAMSAGGSTSGDSAYIDSIIDERYRVIRLVGRGGMGSVYEVEHVHMKKQLAMKLLHEDLVVRKQLVNRFIREARAVSKLTNEHTVRVFDFGRHGAVFFLVMEMLDGEDLEVILSREGALPWRRALGILDQVCQSLAEAHTRGIIHRDLKPENIMMVSTSTGEDYAKVLDFGLAKVTDPDEMFNSGSHRDLFGTPYYMAPEQIRAEPVDRRADIYALGCLVFRMLTNRHVYDAPYAFDVLRQQLTAPIPSVCRAVPEAGVPGRVDRLVWRALAKKPEHRFPAIEAMRREIQGCLLDPDGESLIVNAPEKLSDADSGAAPLDPDLVARLQAFGQSHEAAKARMAGASPSSDAAGDSPEAAHPPLRTRGADARASDPPASMPSPDYEVPAMVLASRRRKRLLATVGVLAAVALLVAGGMVALSLWQRDTGSSSSEKEPNNLPKDATVMRPNGAMTGTLGEPLSVVESDRDFYKLALGGANRFVELELTALPGVDLVLDVLDAAGHRITRVDYAPAGASETLHRLRAPSDELMLVVSESTSGDGRPSANVPESYSLLATVRDAPSDGGEVEPNDTWPAANAFRPSESVAGYLDGPKDIDYFRIERTGPDSERRFEVRVESETGLVPRITLYRGVGDDMVAVFADEGREGLLRTAYEEPVTPARVYVVAVEHARRGELRGPYRLMCDIRPARPRLAVEPDDDRARGTALDVGQEARGVVESGADQDVFAIPVTDPAHRTIEILVDPKLQDQIQFVLTDTNGSNERAFPPRGDGGTRTPQPIDFRRGFLRFKGDGETYFLAVSLQKTDVKNVEYGFRVLRLMTEAPSAAVGGPY